MDALEALHTRASNSALGEPGPGEAQLAALLKAAEHAPDHGLMRPWRFFVVRGEARNRLGQAMAAALRAREPEATPEILDRERQKPLRAPVLLVVAASPRERRGVPEIEQVLAAAAAAENVMLAAHAIGLGAYWRTGDAAYDPAVKAAFGLAPSDTIVGFLYLGTPLGTPGTPSLPRRPRPESQAFDWHGPGEMAPRPIG
jgi:nitroreductase